MHVVSVDLGAYTRSLPHESRLTANIYNVPRHVCRLLYLYKYYLCTYIHTMGNGNIIGYSVGSMHGKLSKTGL